MNLVRVLFKKQHPSSAERAPAAADGGGAVTPPRHSASVDVDSEPGETSPTTTRSPRRKARSPATTAVDAGEPRPPPSHTTVFKPVKMTSHRRFAQVLPNLLLGTRSRQHTDSLPPVNCFLPL